MAKIPTGPTIKPERQWALAKIVPYPKNARTHPPAQIALLAELLKRWGPDQAIVVDAVDFDFASKRPDLVVCFLSLMFVPVKLRLALVERMKAAIARGGAVVVFDKMVPTPGYLGTVAFRLTLAAKYEAGAKPDEIIAKELSIAGLQRPMSPTELPGFVEVFRFGDFAGFVHERAA